MATAHFRNQKDQVHRWQREQSPWPIPATPRWPRGKPDPVFAFVIGGNVSKPGTWTTMTTNEGGYERNKAGFPEPRISDGKVVSNKTAERGKARNRSRGVRSTNTSTAGWRCPGIFNYWVRIPDPCDNHDLPERRHTDGHPMIP